MEDNKKVEEQGLNHQISQNDQFINEINDIGENDDQDYDGDPIKKINANIETVDQMLHDLIIGFKQDLSQSGIYRHLEKSHGIREIWKDDWYESYTDIWESKWHLVFWQSTDSKQQIQLWYKSECQTCVGLYQSYKEHFNPVDDNRRLLIKKLRSLKEKKKYIEKQIIMDQQQKKNEQDELEEQLAELKKNQKKKK